MRQQRSLIETITDEALTLSLLAEAESVPNAPTIDRLRLQKLIYQVAYTWFERRWKGFNYAFFRYRHGPFTKDLYQTEVDLAAAGLIQGGNGWAIGLSADGRELAEQLIERVWLAGDNSIFWNELRGIIREHAAMSTPALISKIYASDTMPIGWREAWPLSDLPVGVDLTRILEDEESAAALEMPPEWVDTFGLTIARASEGHDLERLHAV